MAPPQPPAAGVAGGTCVQRPLAADGGEERGEGDTEGEAEEESTAALLPPGKGADAEFHPVWQRWWMLCLVAALAATQGGMWSNFGPISNAVEPLLGWGDGTIALLANWGPIMYLLAFLPYAWLFNERGLRPAGVLTACLIAGGAALRCISTSRGAATTALMHLGQLLNGIAGPFAMSAGPVLSAVWFPPHERTTATAFASALNYGGSAVMFVVGPALVPDPGSTSGELDLTPEQSEDLPVDLRRYMVGEAVFAVALLLAVVCYFPSMPPSLPSHTAGIQRENTVEGTKKLMGMRSFWIVCASYSIVTGPYGAWGSMIGPNLKHVLDDDSETTAGWIGFWGAIGGCVSGIGGSILADWLQRRAEGQARELMKYIVIGLLGVGALVFTAFALICVKALPMEKWALYALGVAGGFAINGTIPFFYELAVEAAYPVGEGVTTCMLTAGMNIFGFLFLLTPVIPGMGTQWMNWCVAVCSLLGCAAMLPFPARLARLEEDVARMPGWVSRTSCSAPGG